MHKCQRYPKGYLQVDKDQFVSSRKIGQGRSQMIAQRSGVIIHITSIQGKLPLYDSTLPCAAAKAGLINYSKSLSNEVAPKGGRVLTVSPGWIMTDGSKRIMERISENGSIIIEQATQSVMDALEGIPYGRAAMPEEVARVGSLTINTDNLFPIRIVIPLFQVTQVQPKFVHQ